MSNAEHLATACSALTLGDLIKPGVYVLMCDDDVAYVGQSSNVLTRIAGHVGKFKFDRLFFLSEESKTERLAIEGALMRRFNPPNCRVSSSRQQHRDTEILARFGLELDPVAAAEFAVRQAACWRSEVTTRAAEERRRGRDGHKRRAFGDVIKKLRECAGLTQERAASALGVTQACVSRWEVGDLVPRNAERLAAAYGCDAVEVAKIFGAERSRRSE